VDEELGTIGAFSCDARTEAIRDGTPAINLVDGQELVSLLKHDELGVKTVVVDKVGVDTDGFQSI